MSANDCRPDADSLPAPLWPPGEANRKLELAVRPPDWTNPQPARPYQLLVIGGGTAGLVAAAGAAGLGARVALVERQLMGGDCLNTGCVPSKALLAAAKRAQAIRSAAGYGISPGADDVQIEFDQVMRRMRELRAAIAPHDSVARFTELGVDVHLGSARFVDHHSVEVASHKGHTQRLEFSKAVIATGARAAIPGIEGLSEIDVLTNETLFSLETLPARLGVIGAGPIGCEMAQAFARLGSRVILFGRGPAILPREDRDAAQCVQNQLQRDGVQLELGSPVSQVRLVDGEVEVCVDQHNPPRCHRVSHLLLATGRAANVEDLELQRAGIEYDRKGVRVNDFLQTSNPRVFAAGDVCSEFQFTHAADFQARIVLQNALFAVGPLGRKRASRLRIPWATYTSPELAHVGLTAEEAERQGIAVDTFEQSMAGNDRAMLESLPAQAPEGFVRVHTRRGSDQIVGATVVGEQAGELISEITLAMNCGAGLSKIGSSIHPYPTRSDAIRRLGDQFNRTRLTPMSRRVLGWLRWWNVGQ